MRPRQQYFNPYPSRARRLAGSTLENINADNVPDVQGFFRDILIREEDAARHLDRIQEQLEWVKSQIDSASNRSEPEGDSLSNLFLERVGEHRAIDTLIDEVLSVKGMLKYAIDELNSSSRLGEELKNSLIEDPVFTAISAWLAASVTLVGGVLGSVAGPVGTVAGSAAGAAIGSTLSVEARTGHVSDLSKAVSDINTMVDQLDGFAKRIEDGAQWVHAHISTGRSEIAG